MKRIFKFFSLLFLTSLMIFGCAKDVVINQTKISNGEDNLVGDLVLDIKNVKLQTIYEKLEENNQEKILKMLIEIVANKEIDFEDEENIEWYENEVNEFMKKKFVDDTNFKVNNKFSEQLVINFLESEIYHINCENEDPILNKEYFNCDYSYYIDRHVKYEVYEKMLIQKYIIEEKTKLINKQEFRKINYITVAKDNKTGVFVTLDYLLNAIDELDNQTIENLQAIEQKIKDEKMIDLDNDFSKILDPIESNYYTLMEKFTKCGNVRCTPAEGLQYQKDLIQEKEYIKEAIVNKNNESLFNEEIRIKLFSKTIADKLVAINGINYLTAPNDNYNNTFIISDALIFDAASSLYYLIQVEELDSTSNFHKLLEVAKKIEENISLDEAISNYLNKYEIDIYEDQFKEFLVETLTSYEIE